MATYQGNSADDDLAGGVGADSLAGRGGDDTLTGGWGDIVYFGTFPFSSFTITSSTDGDTLRGGDGDDRYQVTATASQLWAEEDGERRMLTSDPPEHFADVVIEKEHQGIDTVVAFVSYALSPNVERLLLSDLSFAIDGTGNNLDNFIRGNDRANVLDGRAGDDTLSGRQGFDTASYASASSGVIVSLAISGAQPTSGAGTDSLSSIEGLRGSRHADWLAGDGGRNTLWGSGGADTLLGAGGDDRLIGDAGDDSLVGGSGVDVASYGNAAGKVLVRLSIAGSQDTGGAGHDSLFSVENVTGSPFADRLYGNESANVLNGEAGNDKLFGAGGDDSLRGGNGDDLLAGGTGDDSFILTDLFAPEPGTSNVDTIVGFSHLGDRIILEADVGTPFGIPAPDGVTMIGSSRFHTGSEATDPAHRIVYDQDAGVLYYDGDGDGLIFDLVPIAVFESKPVLTYQDIYVAT